MFDGQNVFDQPIKNNLIIYDNIRIISTGQGGYYGFKLTNYKTFISKYWYFKKTWGSHFC